VALESIFTVNAFVVSGLVKRRAGLSAGFDLAQGNTR
jgi:hypothetical protein